MPHILFGRSKELEIEIKEYLDLVNQGSLTFKRDLSRYIKKNFEPELFIATTKYNFPLV